MADDKPPLRLIVEPDEYLCTWLLPGPDGTGTEYAGAVDLRPSQPPVGTVHGPVPIRWTETAPGVRGAGFPQITRLPQVRARLASGYDVTLVDVTVIYWSAEHGIVRAASAAVGVPSRPRGFGWDLGRDDRDSDAHEVMEDAEEDVEVDARDMAAPVYASVTAQVGALDALAGASPFSGWTFPASPTAAHLEGEWTVSGNPDSSQEWSDDQVTVRLEYDSSVSLGNGYAFRFAVSPVVRIEANADMTVRDWVDRWVSPLRKIASIATGTAQPLTYLAVTSAPSSAVDTDTTQPAAPARGRTGDPDGTPPRRLQSEGLVHESRRVAGHCDGATGFGLDAVGELDAALPGPTDPPGHPPSLHQIYGAGITQHPYASDAATVREAETVVHVAADGLSLLAMLRAWQRLEDDHHPLVETYGAMLSATADHPRSRFLLLVQALEGLYGYETAAVYRHRQERHDEDRATLLALVEDAGVLNGRQRRFLRNNLARHPQRGLDEALRELLGQLPVDLTPNLAACQLLDDYLASAQGPERQRVAYAVAKIRNDLAHGNRGFDVYALSQAVRVLERVVRSHALRLLGCPDSILERVCRLQ